MAEIVVGVVASGAGLASLAMQLFDGAKKLKTFRDTLKNAPELLADVILDLETLSLALQQLELYRQSSRPNTALLDRCIQRCQHSANRVKCIVAKLECVLHKFDLKGRLLLAFKDKDVQDLLADLDRSKGSLLLAHQLFMFEEHKWKLENTENTLALQIASLQSIQQTNQLLLKHALPHATEVAGSGTDQRPILGDFNGINPLQCQEPIECSRASRRHHAIRSGGLTCRLAPWFVNAIWILGLKRAEGSWRILFQTHVPVPPDAPIIRSCQEGDLDAVTELINTHQASVRSETCGRFRHTLLEIAMLGNHVEISRFLLSRLNLAGDDQELGDALSLAVEVPGRPYDALFRMLIEEFDMDVSLSPTDSNHSSTDMDYYIPDWWRYLDDPTGRAIIVRNQPFPWKLYPVQQRLTIVVSLLRDQGPEIFLRDCGLSEMQDDIASLELADGSTLLHIAAGRIAKRLRQGHDAADWLDFVSTLFKNNAKSSTTLRKTPMTPFAYGLSKITVNLYLMRSYVRLWVSTAYSAGVDLGRYGSDERHLLHTLLEQRGSQGHGGYRRRVLMSNDFTVGDLIHGLRPDDWDLVLCHKRHIQILKRQEPPGAWFDCPYLPRQLTWLPDRSEAAECVWSPVSSLLFLSKYSPLKKIIQQYECDNEWYTSNVERCQDDSSAVSVLVERFRSRKQRLQPSAKQRSGSQPPPTKRKELIYWEGHISAQHPWLPPCHFCPVDGRYRIGCVLSDQTQFLGVRPWCLIVDQRCCAVVAQEPDLLTKRMFRQSPRADMDSKIRWNMQDYLRRATQQTQRY